MYILGLCKVGLSETFMQLFGSPQHVIILAGRSCARLAVRHQCPALGGQRGGVFCCEWFYCWRQGTDSNIVQLSGPDRGHVLEENFSLDEVKHFDEEGWEAKRRVRAVLSQGCGFGTKGHLSNFSSCQEAMRRQDVISLAGNGTQTHLYLQP